MTTPGQTDDTEAVPGVALEDLVSVYVIWDAAFGSPVELQQFGGAVVAVPPYAIPLPARGKLFGVRGFSRQRAVEGEGDTRWEWVLQGDADPVDQFVDGLVAGLPGGGAWRVPAGRAAVKLMIQRMFSAGIPRAAIVAQVPAFVNAVAAEVSARNQAAPMASGGADEES